MPLPYVVEYLLSYRDDAGREIVTQNSQILTLNGVLAGTRVVSRVSIPATKESIIVYRSVFSNAIVPAAWTLDYQIEGNSLYAGLVTATTLIEPIDSFVFVGKSPGTVDVTNVSGLAQNFEMIISYLTIASGEAYRKVMTALKEMKPRDIP